MGAAEEQEDSPDVQRVVARIHERHILEIYFEARKPSLSNYYAVRNRLQVFNAMQNKYEVTLKPLSGDEATPRVVSGKIEIAEHQHIRP